MKKKHLQSENEHINENYIRKENSSINTKKNCSEK